MINYKSLGVVIVLLLFATLLSSTASGQSSNNSCYHTAYTVDSSNTHFSLIKNDSFVIGQRLVIESNCPITYITSNFQITESNLIIQTIPLDLDNFQIIQDNKTYSYSNFTVFPSDNMDFFNLEYGDDDLISSSNLWTSELLAHGITFLILYVFSTSIVYRLAKNKVDNSIELII